MAKQPFSIAFVNLPRLSRAENDVYSELRRIAPNGITSETELREANFNDFATLKVLQDKGYIESHDGDYLLIGITSI